MKWIYLFSITLLLACNNTKNVGKAQEKSPKSQASLTDQELFLVLERSPCYGTCPSFKVVVTNNGTAYYEGRKFVDRIGTYEAALSLEQANEIKAKAEEVGYYQLENRYDDPGVTDVPTMIIQLAGTEGMKSVYSRFNMPEDLKSFGKYLDGILLNLDWKETSANIPASPPLPPTPTRD